MCSDVRLLVSEPAYTVFGHAAVVCGPWQHLCDGGRSLELLPHGINCKPQTERVATRALRHRKRVIALRSARQWAGRTAHAEAGLVHVLDLCWQHVLQLWHRVAQGFGILLCHDDWQRQGLRTPGLRSSCDSPICLAIRDCRTVAQWLIASTKASNSVPASKPDRWGAPADAQYRQQQESPGSSP